MNPAEPTEIVRRYARRPPIGQDLRYSMLTADVLLTMQERQRALIRLLSRHATAPLSELKVVEIGCGAGANLLELLRFGFRPQNLAGNELLPERAERARENLPAACEIFVGDASELQFAAGSFDIVFQSTVFTSLLDRAFQQRLAARMWQWTKPGGGVLWYDFVYDNPANPDVRGVPVRRIRELFPQANISVARVTLAPPISRRVCRVYPPAYHLLNAIPLLRTHVLCWLSKGNSS